MYDVPDGSKWHFVPTLRPYKLYHARGQKLNLDLLLDGSFVFFLRMAGYSIYACCLFDERNIEKNYVSCEYLNFSALKITPNTEDVQFFYNRGLLGEGLLGGPGNSWPGAFFCGC